MTQNPAPPGSSWWNTGALARSQVNHSCGMPWVNRSRSSRSIWATSTVVLPLVLGRRSRSVSLGLARPSAPAELGRPLLDEGQRAFLGVVAGEHFHADLRVDAHGLVLRDGLGGPQR